MHAYQLSAIGSNLVVPPIGVSPGSELRQGQWFILATYPCIAVSPREMTAE